MALARFFMVVVLIFHWKTGVAQQNSVTTNPFGLHQTAQNNDGFSTQNNNQNMDSRNFNVQLQQCAKQAGNPQQNLNIQQLSNIPMQTFNVQQPVHFQNQASSQPVNFQPMTQSTNLQHPMPQSINLQQDVLQPAHMQQTLSNPSNLQQATVFQSTNLQQSSIANSAQKSVNLQQSLPVQQHSLNLQQQANPYNLQHSQVQAVNLQPQTTPQPINLQQPLFVQPINFQQQPVPNFVNMQQQATPQPVYLQQSPVVQPVTYQQPVQVHDPISMSHSILQQSYAEQQSRNLQPITTQKLNVQQQQQIPFNNIEGYQVISYQTPFQQKDVSHALPISSLQLTKNPVTTNPMVMGDIATALPSTNAAKQTADHLYLVSSQACPTYTPVVITDNSQPTSLWPMVLPITAVSNLIPSLTTNLISNNQNQHLESREHLLSSSKLPDLESLNILQCQPSIASLLSEPTSSAQSALLSSILSSIQNPSASSQYTVPSNYPSQTVVSPQSIGSKLSLKSLLPLLLNLLQEKYTDCGCRHCCNCECSQNDDNFHEPQVTTVNSNELEFKETEKALLKNEESEELKDVHLNTRDRKKPRQYLNIIPDNSVEIDAENSSCEEEDQDEIIYSGEEDS